MNPAKRKKLMLLGILKQPEEVKVQVTLPEPVQKVEIKVEEVAVVEVKQAEEIVAPVVPEVVEEEKPQKVKKFKKLVDSQE